MTHYFIEPGTRKYVKGYGFLSFARNLSNKYVKQLLNTASKEVIYKTGEYLGNQIADAVAKLCDDKIVKQEPVINGNSRNLKEIIIPPEKRDEILNELRQVL